MSKLRSVKLRNVKYMHLCDFKENEGITARREYKCRKDWSDDIHLQCGDRVHLKKTNKYSNAFFEIFISGTFLRGEGETIEEAENNAYEKYKPMLECKEHFFERKGRKDRDGVCSKCGFIHENYFKPSHSCTICNKPYVMLEINSHYFCINHFIEQSSKMDLIIDEKRIKQIKQEVFDEIIKKSEKENLNLVELCAKNNEIKKIDDLGNDHYQVEYKIDSIKEQKWLLDLYLSIKKSQVLNKLEQTHDEFELIELINETRSNTISFTTEKILGIIQKEYDIIIQFDEFKDKKENIYFYSISNRLIEEEQVFIEIETFFLLKLIDIKLKQKFNIDNANLSSFYYGKDELQISNELSQELRKDILRIIREKN